MDVYSKNTPQNIKHNNNPHNTNKQYYINKLKNSHCIYIRLTMTISNMRIQLNYYYFFVGMTGIFNKISHNVRLLFRK